MKNKLHQAEKSEALNTHQKIFVMRLEILIKTGKAYKIVNTDVRKLCKQLYSMIVTELNYMLPKIHQKQLLCEEVLNKLAELAYSDLFLKSIQYSNLYKLGDEVSIKSSEISDFILTDYRKVAMEYLQERYSVNIPVRTYKPIQKSAVELKLERHETYSRTTKNI